MRRAVDIGICVASTYVPVDATAMFFYFDKVMFFVQLTAKRDLWRVALYFWCLAGALFRPQDR